MGRSNSQTNSNHTIDGFSIVSIHASHSTKHCLVLGAGASDSDPLPFYPFLSPWLFSLRISSMSFAQSSCLRSQSRLLRFWLWKRSHLLFPQESFDEYVNTNRKIENTSRKKMFFCFQASSLFLVGGFNPFEKY